MNRSKQAGMVKNAMVVWLVALALAPFYLAEAQQATKVYRIGYLSSRGSPPPQEFVQALRNLGYVEGKNITFEHRSADRERQQVPDFAAELVRLKVDTIVAEGTGRATAAKRATSTIPIVMAESTDPVGTGLVASLASPECAGKSGPGNQVRKHNGRTR